MPKFKKIQFTKMFLKLFRHQRTPWHLGLLVKADVDINPGGTESHLGTYIQLAAQ